MHFGLQGAPGWAVTNACKILEQKISYTKQDSLGAGADVYTCSGSPNGPNLLRETPNALRKAYDYRLAGEGAGVVLVLVGQDLDVGQARGIIDADMQIVPTPTSSLCVPGPRPVTLWPERVKRPSFLLSRWTSSPGAARS